MAVSGAFDLWTIQNPSQDLTDFSLYIDLSRATTFWWSLVDTNDPTRGRAAKEGGGIELPTDWIDFDRSSMTGWVRVKWINTLSVSGTQRVQIFPPQLSNPPYAVSDPFGSQNAYPDNLQMYLPNGGGDDRSSNGLTATTHGAPILAAGKTVRAYTFDGDDSFEMSPTATPIGIADSYSLSAWVNIPAGGGGQIICSDLINGSGGRHWQFRVTDGLLTFIPFRNGGTPIVTVRGTTDIRGTGWRHILANFENSRQEIFIDTVSESAGTEPFDNTNLALTIEIAANDIVNERLTGLVAEASIYNTQLTAGFYLHEYAQTNNNALFWGTPTHISTQIISLHPILMSPVDLSPIRVSQNVVFLQPILLAPFDLSPTTVRQFFERPSREVLQELLVRYMQIDDSRVAFYAQEFDQPNDRNLFILINNAVPEIVGVKNQFDPINNEEKIYITQHEQFSIDIASKNEDAYLRKEEIVMSFYSQIAQELEERNGIRFFRPSQIIDLTAVEGAGGLHRYRIDVIISTVTRKITPVDVYDKFIIPEVIEDV